MTLLYNCRPSADYGAVTSLTLEHRIEMKHILALLPLLLILSVVQSSGQPFEELEFGTDATFEVVTWNIEWFPKAGQTTVDYVSQIIEALDVDMIAMQELDDTDAFDQMMDGLVDYVGYYESGWFAGLAYIYNPDAIVINDIYEIYTTEEYWNAFPRSPMVMDLSFEGENIFVINNHYKCCGDAYWTTATIPMKSIDGTWPMNC